MQATLKSKINMNAFIHKSIFRFKYINRFEYFKHFKHVFYLQFTIKVFQIYFLISANEVIFPDDL